MLFDYSRHPGGDPMTNAFVCTIAAALTITASAGAASAQAPPPLGPEHQILSTEAGTWDAVVEMTTPDGSSMRATGTQEDTLSCGGRCLVTAFNGDLMPGATFEGRGVTTWDGAKKKYVGAWTDSMSSGMSVSEGTYDASTKTMTSTMEGPDMSGAVVKSRSTVQYTDTDHK